MFLILLIYYLTITLTRYSINSSESNYHFFDNRDKVQISMKNKKIKISFSRTSYC